MAKAQVYEEITARTALGQRLPKLSAAADLSERQRLLLTVLDAVYIAMPAVRAVVGIRARS